MIACPFCSKDLPDVQVPRDAVRLLPCPACANPIIMKWEGHAIAAATLERVQDIRHVAPKGSIGGAILEALPKAVRRLPVLPEISQRVLVMVRDPNVSMNDLAQVIRQDQVIALAIMKLSNSAVYGGLQEIKELNAACARLGMRTIANTVQTVANSNLFNTGDERLRGFMKKLWKHSIATAHSASEIAALLAEPRAETLFLAGLIHDVGKVVMLDIITGEYAGAVAELRVTPELLREVIDSFHPLIGLHVCQHWGLPAEFGALVYCHHTPAICPHEPWLSMTHTVALANLIAKLEGFGLYEPEETFLTSNESARFLNLTDIRLAALRVDLTDKLNAQFQAANVD